MDRRGGAFTFGNGTCGQLGHGAEDWPHPVPRCKSIPTLVEALAGKNVIGASAGNYHTAVWTDANEILTFGSGFDGEFGHLNEEDE